MKKLLALVLALVMTLGLATVGANAAYKDADSINYKEAVDVMSAIGVLAGDETGFRPTDTLKRSEGAKIIAYLIAGKATADAMTATGTKYTDLPANHWAAGYMEYLSAIGVMGGLGDGRIDPDGSLSATAFAKMLLVALGYDATIEKMGGADWQINTQRLANKVGLFKGNSAVVGSAAITREEAALYALNTLKAPVVEYETKGTSINVGDASITTGASNATYMTTTDSSARYRNIDNARVNGNGAQIVEFAEQYYDGLKLEDAGTDAFGRPANVWMLKGKEVGTYSKSADLQYTAEVKMGTIYSDLGLTNTIAAANVSVYEDGVLATNANTLAGTGHGAWNGYAIAKGSDNKVGGNGALTEVYFDDDARTAEIFVTNTYFTKIEAVYAASSTKDAYVVFNGTDNTGAGAEFKTEDFKVGDYVLYTYSYKAGEECVESAELATVTQGKLESYQVKTNVTVDGTTVKSNVVAASKASISSSLQNAIGTTVTVFKDKYDYAVYVDATAASDAYAVLLGWTGADSVGTSVRNVTLLFADGTKKTVTASGIYDTDDSKVLKPKADEDIEDKTTIDDTDTYFNIGDIFTYRVNSKGEYRLTLASKTEAVNADTTITTKGTSALGVAFDDTLDKANGKTVFALYNSEKGSVNVYTGIANVPTVVSADDDMRATAFDKATEDGYADLVWMDVSLATVTKSSKDVIFIKGGAAGAKYNSAYGTYYEYDAIINNEITTIMVDTAVTKYTLVTDMTKNSDGVYEWSTKGSVVNDAKAAAVSVDPVFYTVGTQGAVNGVIRFGDGDGYDYNYVSLASNPKVFRINTDGVISESTLNAIQTDANDQVFWKTTDDLADFIVVKTVDDAVDQGTASGVTFLGEDVADKSNNYANPVVYNNAGYGDLSHTAMQTALNAQMVADGCTNIVWLAYNSVYFTNSDGMQVGTAAAPMAVNYTQKWKVVINGDESNPKYLTATEKLTLAAEDYNSVGEGWIFYQKNNGATWAYGKDYGTESDAFGKFDTEIKTGYNEVTVGTSGIAEDYIAAASGADKYANGTLTGTAGQAYKIVGTNTIVVTADEEGIVTVPTGKVKGTLTITKVYPFMVFANKTDYKAYDAANEDTWGTVYYTTASGEYSEGVKADGSKAPTNAALKANSAVMKVAGNVTSYVEKANYDNATASAAGGDILVQEYYKVTVAANSVVAGTYVTFVLTSDEQYVAAGDKYTLTGNYFANANNDATAATVNFTGTGANAVSKPDITVSGTTDKATTLSENLTMGNAGDTTTTIATKAHAVTTDGIKGTFSIDFTVKSENALSIAMALAG